MPITYALLVGINHYHPESKQIIPMLKGCLNDVDRWQAFLEMHFPEEQRHIKVLKEKDATYQNVVNHFGDEFLLQAQAGDTVLFVFSGHGSRENAAPEFLPYYPEGKSETLVLYDSRTSDGLDLADKELAILVERIASKEVHVAVVLDCCHSGSGTRVIDDFKLGAARQTSYREGIRPLYTYLNGAYLQHRDKMYLPNSRHILLAACDRKEKAWEVGDHGLFTATLLPILEETRGQITYANLFSRCYRVMAQKAKEQHPTFEPYGFFNAQRGFLNFEVDIQQKTLSILYNKSQWELDGGATHGLPVDTNKPAIFVILDGDTTVGYAKSVTVGMQTSTLQLDFAADTRKEYQARLLSLPTPKMPVQWIGEGMNTALVQRVLDEIKPLYFEIQMENNQVANTVAPYRVEVSHQRIQLFRQTDGLCLRTLLGSEWENMLTDMFQKLEHIAKWERTIALDNKNSKLRSANVDLILTEIDDNGNILRQSSDPEVIMELTRADGGGVSNRFQVEVRNNHSFQTIYCTLFYGTSSYYLYLVNPGAASIPPGKSSVLWDTTSKGNPLRFVLKDKIEAVDTFKMFVSLKPLNLEHMILEGFEVGKTEKYEKLRSQKTIMDYEEGISTKPVSTDENDWYSTTMCIKSVIKEPGIDSDTTHLNNQAVIIYGHPHFRANITTQAIHSGSKSLDPMAILADLSRGTNIELLTLGTGGEKNAAPNVLELVDYTEESSLANNPLQIELKANLKATAEEEEFLLPLTFDGEHILSLGETERLENGNAMVKISHLPKTHDERRRSLGKAIKMCFLKVVLRRKEQQHLCWVDYSGAQVVRQTDHVKEKVSTAHHILLVVHGIIGDTQVMAEAMRPVSGGRPFDLVLSFDYENLHTRIEATAGLLSDKLKEVGITPESDKNLTIVAHSMGGLVSRYYIEHLAGRQIVRHLIMAGTPNAGSAIADITIHRDNLVILLGIALATPWVAAELGILLGLLKGTKLLTTTLQQMDYDDDAGLLKNLGRTADPGVQYSIVAGDLYQYLPKKPEAQGLIDKLYKAGARLFYGEEPNDIAVSVQSIRSVPENWQPSPKVVEVGCHHLNYFEETESVAVLMGILGK